MQLIEQFIVSIWCGACRFAHTETVRMDGTLVRLFGWTKAAGHKAIMRLFARFDMLANERVQAEAYLMSLFRQAVLRSRIQHTLLTLHGLVLAIGGSWHHGASQNRLMLSVPRRKRAWFSGLWANASAPPVILGR